MKLVKLTSNKSERRKSGNMNTSEIDKVAQGADFIVNGFAFLCKGGEVHVLNLNNAMHTAVLNVEGEVLATSMDDIEVSIVQAYWERNKQFAEE